MILDAVGCNYWSPEGGLGALPSSIPGIVEWWESWPGFGNPWVRSDASINPDVTAWAKDVGMVITANQSDPLGGNTAFKVTESVDGAPANHYVYTSRINSAASFFDLLIWLKAAARPWHNSHSGGAAEFAWVSQQDGTIGNIPPTADVRLLSTVGSWYRFMIGYRTIPSSVLIYTRGTTANGVNAYIGNGSDSHYIYNPIIRQERLQQLNGMIGGNHATDGGGGPNVQALFQDTFLTTMGPFAKPLSEPGRVTTQSVTGAPVLAAFNVGSENHVIFGVRQLDVNLSPIYYAGGGGIDQLYCSGVNIMYARNAVTRTYAGAFPGLGVPFSFALVCTTAGGNSLWINGVLQGTFGASGVNPAVTYLDLADPLVAANSSAFPATAIGVSPVASHAAIYESIRPSLIGMWKRWLSTTGAPVP